MNARLNGILTTLAQQYNFNLLQNAPTDESRIRYLADNLANHGVLVITADIPINSYNLLTKTWMNNYYYLYAVFAKNLFSFTGDGITFDLVDQMRPPVALMQAKSTAVIQVMASYVVPYIAMCKQTGNISSPEIRGLVAYILEDLEATNIDRVKYDRITNNGEELIKRLIALPFQQYTLTTMKEPLFPHYVQPQMIPDDIPMPAPSSTTGPLDPNKVIERPKIMPETGRLDPSKAVNPKSTSERPKVMPETGRLDPSKAVKPKSMSERPKVMPETGRLDPSKAVNPKSNDATQPIPSWLNLGNREDSERTSPVRPPPKKKS